MTETSRIDERERGAAMLLSLLVLTILTVLVVQFAFSVKVESTIVKNGKDDATMEFAARGVVPIVQALFQEDRSAGEPAGDIDTLADILFDPKADGAREFTLGEVTLVIEAEDAERRFPLPWLAREDRKKWAVKALEELIKALEIEDENGTSPEDLAKALAEKVTSLIEEAKPAVLPANPDDAPVSRGLVSIEQLLDTPPPADGSSGDATPSDTPAPVAGAGGVSRLVLFGDPKADPPKEGLAYYVTTWDVEKVNLNTVLPEVLGAMLPDEDKSEPKKNLRESMGEIIDAVREYRIDPEFQGSEGEGEEPAPAGEEAGQSGASKSWPGKAFTEAKELENTEIHEKLQAVFTKPETQGSGAGGAGGTQTGGTQTGGTQTGGTQTGGTQTSGGTGEEEDFDLKKAFGVRSQIYLLKVTVSLSEDVSSVYRVVVTRNDVDEVRALLIEEVPQ